MSEACRSQYTCLPDPSPVEEPLVLRLRSTLWTVRQMAGPDFSGIGLIVHTRDADLPIYPLRSGCFPTLPSALCEALASIAVWQSDFHDGFHLISTDWALTAVAQYFSPPIVKRVVVDRTRLFGGRYLAALFGSVIGGVELTGIASNDFGLAIFKRGREVHFEELP
jgi:hypothetical protein